MHYPIPGNLQEMTALNEHPINEELVAAAIAGVIQISRSQGQTLEDVRQMVLAEDDLLDTSTRKWLSEIVGQAWDNLS
ncbi:hypothetical protein L3556_14300 [Candidatus Synechococcus calcipolaris G9]|uniref:Uncharacterized protein n=1 Tax=Candidatus Synechococcus calcipolaris G9 TaxID=1497997 RepID=A0ABT6F2M2_9SYNE|nr:hypothetical protein [Candidatus Synechococcus calcipolaris]MDG2992093.1 hypothetical protein [Candidatus Synechococcus calcipolaris G9]